MSNDLRIGSWDFSPDLHELRRGSTIVRLEPKCAEVLRLLAQRPGELVTREEILSSVWKDVHVTEEVLTNAIYQLRRVFEDDARRPRTIQTIPRKGYRLIATVPVEETPRPAPSFRAPRTVLAAAVALLLGITIALALLTPHTAFPESDESDIAEAAILLDEGTVDSAVRALALYDGALSKNEDRPPALAGRALARLSLVSDGALASELAHPAIERDATRAIRIDPDLAEGHLALGALRMIQWEWQPAEEHLRRALLLAPRSGIAHATLAELLLLTGRKEESRELALSAGRLAPESPRVLLSAGFIHTMLREREAAQRAYGTILRRRPEHVHARRQLEKLSHVNEIAAPLDRGELIERIDALLRKGQVRPAIVAGMFAEAGESEKALHWLRRARDEKDMSLLLVRLDDRWKGLHGDPRLRAILADAGPTGPPALGQ
ncbi:MAG TPA: winged helix-turn-helix domain-containing protein [Thermoanaerobaculia bacterium]|nr:winged helix-turn-helix domain-containing protein [Thermoanaerobaculia bacterium]